MQPSLFGRRNTDRTVAAKERERPSPLHTYYRFQYASLSLSLLACSPFDKFAIYSAAHHDVRPGFMTAATRDAFALKTWKECVEGAELLR